MPDRPAHPYGLSPDEEPADASPRTRREARRRREAPGRPAPHTTDLDLTDLTDRTDPDATFQAAPASAGSRPTRRSSRQQASQPGRPPTRRSRRVAQKRSPRSHLAQGALAALAVFALLGGVAVALDRVPGSSAPDPSAAIAATARVAELPSASNDSTPVAAAPSTPGSPPEPVTTPRKASGSSGGSARDARTADGKVGAAETAKSTARKAKQPPRRSTATRAAGAAASVKIGVFRGTSPSGVNTFGNWLGRDVDYASDFSTRSTWNDIADPAYMLKAWQGSGYRMVYATAMLPTQDSSATMAAGAQGEYDQYFTTLAQNLVAYGQGDSIIRLGWEFNLTASRFHPDTRANFIAYWQHIVTAMRSVPGTGNLQFDWNPNIGGENYDSRNYYPGNAYVDYIGVDIYDISWADGAYPFPAGCSAACKQQRREVAWQDKLNGTFGLNFYAAFARSKGKPLTLPEWGLWQRPDGHGGGDNPYFIEQMYKFINDPANNVGYQSYFEFNTGSSGNHALTTLTGGGSAFRSLLGK